MVQHPEDRMVVHLAANLVKKFAAEHLVESVATVAAQVEPAAATAAAPVVASAAASAESHSTAEYLDLVVAAATDFAVAALVAAVVMLRQVSVETERFLVGLRGS